LAHHLFFFPQGANAYVYTHEHTYIYTHLLLLALQGANTPEERHDLEVKAAEKVDAGKVEPGVSFAAKAKGT